MLCWLPYYFVWSICYMVMVPYDGTNFASRFRIEGSPDEFNCQGFGIKSLPRISSLSSSESNSTVSPFLLSRYYLRQYSLCYLPTNALKALWSSSPLKYGNLSLSMLSASERWLALSVGKKLKAELWSNWGAVSGTFSTRAASKKEWLRVTTLAPFAKLRLFDFTAQLNASKLLYSLFI